MDNTEQDITRLVQRLRVRNKVPGTGTLGSEKRRTALLSGLSIVDPLDQQVSPEVAELMEHRQRQTAMTTIALGLLVAQDQDPNLTATLVNPLSSPAIPPPPSTQAAPSTAPPSAEAAIPVSEVPERENIFLHGLQTLVQRVRRRRVPVLQQMSMVECGAACLAMILSYNGRPTSVSE